LQKQLAEEVTRFVHGKEELDKAIQTTQKLFAQQNAPAESLTIEDLEGMEGVAKMDFPRAKLEAGTDLVSFLTETGIFPSKGEARKMVQGGGVTINRVKNDNPQSTVGPDALLHGLYLLVQKGKKNYYLVKAV
jgi:tyrosyl-tRNA synthetase